MHIDSKAFISSIKSLETEDKTALMVSAAVYGDVALAHFLLQDHTVDVNLVNHSGETPLLLCCKGGHIDLLRVSHRPHSY